MPAPGRRTARDRAGTWPNFNEKGLRVSVPRPVQQVVSEQAHASVRQRPKTARFRWRPPKGQRIAIIYYECAGWRFRAGRKSPVGPTESVPPTGTGSQPRVNPPARGPYKAEHPPSGTTVLARANRLASGAAVFLTQPGSHAEMRENVIIMLRRSEISLNAALTQMPRIRPRYSARIK